MPTFLFQTNRSAFALTGQPNNGSSGYPVYFFANIRKIKQTNK